MTSKSKKTVKKKKKKKKGLNDRDGGLDESVGDFRNKNKSDNNVGAAGGAEHNIFFEGGEIEFCMDFEGGSDEEIKMTEEMDAGAESIKSKRSKKKKKKRGGSSARGSSFGRKSSIGNS